MKRSLLALVVACGVLTSSSTWAGRVDAVAASVGRQVVTLSEVDLEARIVLVRKAGETGLHASLDNRLRQKVLQFVVVQMLLAQEARRRGGISVDETDVDHGVAQLKDAFIAPDKSYPRLLAKAAATDEDIRAIVRRDLRVQAFLQQALPGLSDVDDTSVRAYLAAHPELQGPTADGQAREAVLKDVRERAFRKLVDDLRARIDVRLVEQYAGQVAPKAPPP